MNDFDLLEATISDMSAAMADGRITARRLTEQYLERITAHDPQINAILLANPDALILADALDAERETKGVRGPLHGIPIILKDNIDTADKMPTTVGSPALAEHIAAQDAFLVRKLREAGAILLAKANLSEWANFRSTRSSSGWSSQGGQTRNPYALDRNPCGSSSGSAAAVSANFGAAAIGTETDGSVVCPAHINGVVGIKPTLGLISRSGIVPIAHSQDTAGTLTRTVADGAILLTALAGVDPTDPATAVSHNRTPTDYTAALNPDGLRGARLGVARNLFEAQPEVTAVFEESLTLLQDHGAVLVDPANVETAGQISDSEMTVLLYEFKSDLNQYLGRLGPDAPIHTLADLIAFNEAHREQTMPYFGQELFEMAQAKGDLSDAAYQEALARNHRLARTEGIDKVMAEHKLDAIIAPTGNPAWLTDWVHGDHYTGSSSNLAAVAGYPHITVPAGFVHGLPVGLSFIGGAWQEALLIKLAYAFEQTAQARRPPEFKETIF